MTQLLDDGHGDGFWIGTAAGLGRLAIAYCLLALFSSSIDLGAPLSAACRSTDTTKAKREDTAKVGHAPESFVDCLLDRNLFGG